MFVKYNPEVIINSTKNIDEYLKDYNSDLFYIKETIDKIGEIWRGSDSTYFQERINEFNLEINDFEKSLVSINNYLRGYAVAYEKLETQYKNREIDQMK